MKKNIESVGQAVQLSRPNRRVANTCVTRVSNMSRDCFGYKSCLEPEPHRLQDLKEARPKRVAVLEEGVDDGLFTTGVYFMDCSSIQPFATDFYQIRSVRFVADIIFVLTYSRSVAFLAILYVFLFSIVSTWLVFKIFPAIPDAPNVITVFVGMIGVIIGAVELYNLLIKRH